MGQGHIQQLLSLVAKFVVAISAKLECPLRPTIYSFNTHLTFFNLELT